MPSLPSLKNTTDIFPSLKKPIAFSRFNLVSTTRALWKNTMSSAKKIKPVLL